MNPKAIFNLLKQTFSEWSQDKASRLAAALAYFAMFSLGPLVLIVIAVASLVFGEEAARNQIVGQIEGLVGTEGAEGIQTMMQAANRGGAGIIATVVLLGTLAFGAMGVFGQLQDALNTIWEVKPKEGRGIMGMLKDRFLSFSMVLGVGFLLMISLVLSAALAAITSAQILFFGAEFTQVYAKKYGSRVVPADHAEPIGEREREEQGMDRDGPGETDRSWQPERARGEPEHRPSPLGAAALFGAVVGAVGLGIGVLLGRMDPAG